MHSKKHMLQLKQVVQPSKNPNKLHQKLKVQQINRRKLQKKVRKQQMQAREQQTKVKLQLMLKRKH